MEAETAISLLGGNVSGSSIAWLYTTTCYCVVRAMIHRPNTRWSQRRLPLEFMDGLSYTTIIELAEPLARRRGSALDR